MRICFLTPRFPFPPRKGATLRVYQQIRALSAQHAIILVSLAEGPVSTADREALADVCEQVEVVPLGRARVVWNLAAGLLRREPLQVGYFRSGEVRRRLARVLADGHIDVVHVSLIRMLPYAWDLGRPPVLVDLIDSLSLNLATRLHAGPAWQRWAYGLELGRVRAYERAAVRRFPALVVSSPADRAALGEGRIEVIPNGVDLDRFAYYPPDGPEREPATLVFSGNMGYGPNEDAVLWFAATVWPPLRAAWPALRWEIVGMRPGPRVRALAAPESGIAVVGEVPDVTAYLRRATVAVCPMVSGSGIQNKVLEALAVGTPVVATSIANRGVQAAPGTELLVADTPEAFAAAVTGLLASPDARGRLSRAGRALIDRAFRWEQHAARLTSLYGTLLTAD